MYYFCSYFDHRYLSRGLALYQSLRRHCPPFQLWVLCMDRACYNALSQLGLPNINLIALEDFEKDDEKLLKAKQNRSIIEYYFTCTPSLPLFIFNNFPEVDMITYLDADLLFFAEPTPIYDEIADHSIAIIAHRFPEYLRALERFGIFNVGWVSFRRDKRALACLHWWRERCLEWCYDRCEDGRFADQKYLDDWPSLFQGVVVLRHKGANLAPWNLANYRIHGDRNSVWVDEQPLIFFHFHHFKQVKGWLYDPNLGGFKLKPSQILRRSIYSPYIRTLSEVNRDVSRILKIEALRSSARGQLPQSTQGVSLLRRTVRWLRRTLRTSKRMLAREFIFVINGHVI
jgi:hypothetical protein